MNKLYKIKDSYYRAEPDSNDHPCGVCAFDSDIVSCCKFRVCENDVHAKKIPDNLVIPPTVTVVVLE